jgi:hypothetical protein
MLGDIYVSEGKKDSKIDSKFENSLFPDSSISTLNVKA